MSETKYVFYFSPHQDDELLNLGTAMCRDIDVGREVFCVLCTDGGASGARRLIGDGNGCQWHEGAHSHSLTVAEFSAARDREFTASCLAMGVKADHILIPADRAPDGQLTAEHAEKLMRDAIKGFPAKQVTLKTLAEVTWQRQNPDHTAVARAALRLREENACAAVEEYLETILFPAPEGTAVLKTLTPDDAQRNRLLAAAGNYGRWEPEQGFYAVGCHSVWDEFDDFSREQFSRLLISLKGILFRSEDDRMITTQTKGLNPFLPFDTYIPDGEPKVFGDRVYLYGSYDLFGHGYCCGVYHAVSAPLEDLTDWTDHGVCFSVEDVPWSDAVLYAPDALEKDGRYYLFFCLSDGTEGVAESDSPTGPFGNARQITLDGKPIEGIDPSVLAVDGRVYYTWGQFRLRMGELNGDMCTLKPESVHMDVITNGDGGEGFHEGSSLRRIGDKYYLIYASEYTDGWPHHGGRPTKLDYAVSDAPYGPYERRGTVIDNDGCDPATWNNHGSVIRLGDQWYVFYHASSNRTEYSRRARAERLTVDEERCVITKAVPTTNGFVERLTPEMLTSPVHACRFIGGAYVTETPDGRFPAVNLRDGAGFAFSATDFVAGRYTLTLRGRFAAGTKLRVRVGEDVVIDASCSGPAQTGDAVFPFTVPETTAPVTVTFPGETDGQPCEVDALSFQKG